MVSITKNNNIILSNSWKRTFGCGNLMTLMMLEMMDLFAAGSMAKYFL